MKRKVIQIADSTQLISLPRKWCLANSVKKGDELDVEMEGTRVTVSCKPETKIERANLNIKDYGVLAARVIHAMYKKGIDEIQITFDTPEDLQLVQDKIKNETVGYEIVEQDSKSCLIKNISSSILGFDTMLRRTFLLLVNMADECAKCLSKRDMAGLKNLLGLEESNNRFTALCRRYLNKHGAPNHEKVGPLYRILEELENIADEYKYLIKALLTVSDGEVKTSKAMVARYEVQAEMLREYYETFYKFEPSKIADLGNKRKSLVSDWYTQTNTLKTPADFILMHHSLVIVQKVFNIVGPLLVIYVPTSPTV